MARQQDESILLYSGVTAQTIPVQEGATSGSYVPGDLIRFESTGQVILATAAKIAGIATMSFTGSAGSVGDIQPMELIDVNGLYLMTAAGGVAPTQAEVGDAVNLDFSVGAQFAETTSSTPEIFIVGIYPGDYTGAAYTAGGRYIIKFIWHNFLAQ